MPRKVKNCVVANSLSQNLITFASEMKKLELKRRLYARLLLVVLLPMLLLSALHIHEDAAGGNDTCVECVNHQPHNGHLTATTQTLTDCVLCQFFSFQYLEATVVTLAVAACLIILTRPTATVLCPSRPQNLHSSRAPPYDCFPV